MHFLALANGQLLTTSQNSLITENITYVRRPLLNSDVGAQIAWYVIEVVGEREYIASIIVKAYVLCLLRRDSCLILLLSFFIIVPTLKVYK